MIPILLFFGICFFGFGDCDKSVEYNDDWHFVNYLGSEYVSQGFTKGIVELVKPSELIMNGESFLVKNETINVEVGSLVVLEGYDWIFSCHGGAIKFNNGTEFSKSKYPEIYEKYYGLASSTKRLNELTCAGTRYYGDDDLEYYIRNVSLP